MMMEIRDFQFLQAVVEAGSVTRAAQALGCVQSNVTTRLKKCEARLGQRLVERVAGRMVPTAAGRLALDYGARISRLAAEADGHLRAGAQAWPPLRLGTMETTAAVRLPPLLRRVRADLAGLRLSVRTGTSAELVAALRSGALDVAFVAEDAVAQGGLALDGPAGAIAAEPGSQADDAADPRLRAAPLWSEHLVEVRAVADGEGADGTLADGDRADGTGEALVVFRAGCSYRARCEAVFGPRPLMELGTLDGILGCVSAGLGRTLLPEAAVERWRRLGEVATREIAPELATVRTLALWRPRSPAAASIAALVAAARHG